MREIDVQVPGRPKTRWEDAVESDQRTVVVPEKLTSDGMSTMKMYMQNGCFHATVAMSVNYHSVNIGSFSKDIITPIINVPL